MTAIKTQMEAADVTIENARGLFLLRPETERGRLWLVEYGARTGWPWQHGAPAVDDQARATQMIAAMADAGLTVGSFPADSRLKGRATDDGEIVH